MQFGLRNPMVLFSYATSRTCYKMHFNYKHYPIVCFNPHTAKRNVVRVGHFLYINLKFVMRVHLDVLHSMFKFSERKLKCVDSSIN